MAFFTEDTLRFLRGLASNNSKSWFDQHRDDYQHHLKEPYQALAVALVRGVQAREPEYEMDPARATYRINRDLRFAKDKTPYKTDLGITVGRSDRHDPNWPAYTARVGLNGIAVAGGLYMPDNDVRDGVRRYIAEHTASLRTVVSSESFAATYGDLGVTPTSGRWPISRRRQKLSRSCSTSSGCFGPSSPTPTCCCSTTSTSSCSSAGTMPGRSWSFSRKLFGTPSECARPTVSCIGRGADLPINIEFHAGRPHQVRHRAAVFHSRGSSSPGRCRGRGFERGRCPRSCLPVLTRAYRGGAV